MSTRPTLPRVVVALLLLVATILVIVPEGHQSPSSTQGDFRFVFTADPHYGLTRTFRGEAEVSASIVNRALVAAINALPDARLPDGSGTVGPIEFVAIGGDIATRQETAVGTQPAAASWREFETDYLQGMRVPTQSGATASVFVAPGNHDGSNAIGFHRDLSPASDASAMVDMFNLMVRPRQVRTADSYDYEADRVIYSHTVSGVHFVFVHIWPDAAARAWMTRDLAALPDGTPVVIVAHAAPTPETKHFRNPNGRGDINAIDQFENLLSDTFRSGTRITDAPVQEAAAFETFLERQPSIVAYFHGHMNWNEFYTWTGPAGRVSMPVFRADSPMRGSRSGKDESRLSFHVATFEASSASLTVAEYLWNLDPQAPHTSRWGSSTTVSLTQR